MWYPILTSFTIKICIFSCMLYLESLLTKWGVNDPSCLRVKLFMTIKELWTKIMSSHCHLHATGERNIQTLAKPCWYSVNKIYILKRKSSSVKNIYLPSLKPNSSRWIPWSGEPKSHAETMLYFDPKTLLKPLSQECLLVWKLECWLTCGK